MGKNKFNLTVGDLEKLQAEGKIKGYQVLNKKMQVPDRFSEVKKPKKEKYGNNKVLYDGILFASTKEYKRYRVLLLLQKKGIIAALKTQVPYELNEGGTHSLKYIADFVYIDVETGEKVVEDTKGFRTKEYKKRRRLMKKIYGIKIHET